VITDVLDDVGQATAERLGDRVTYLHHDVRNAEEWTAVVAGVVEQHGRLDVLVNNAGIFQTKSIFETTLEDWDRMIAINQTGVFLGMKAVVAQMRDQQAGSIINISSIAGLRGVGTAHAYSATKWAVRGMTKGVAQEMAPYGVRVNSVHPGIIDTDMLREFGEALPMVESRIPMGRTASATEVGNVVLFLASDESAYCSGHEFVVDGAFTA